MKALVLGIILSSMLLLNLAAQSEMYTSTQSMTIPGMSCQLVLISVFDDSGSPADHSDDLHLKTDAFLRCAGLKSGNEHGSVSTESTTMILPGNASAYFKMHAESIQNADSDSYHYLVEIAKVLDACMASNECLELFEKLNDVPDYFKPYMQTLNSEIRLEDYINQLELGKNE